MEFASCLVPVSGEKVDDEVIRLACSLSQKGKGKGRIYIVYVIEMKRLLPLDAENEPDMEKGEKVLAHAEDTARAMDFEVETEMLQAREVGPAIVDEAVERGVDVIVMGINYKRRFGEFDMGSTVPYVFKNAPCRVLLWRDSVDRGET